MPISAIYNPNDWGKDEAEIIRRFIIQQNDAYSYFIRYTKPRIDRSYKLYVSWPGDRAREIKQWQANVFVPYTWSVVETLVPRILDARPDPGVVARNRNSRESAPRMNSLIEYDWEHAKGDDFMEDFVRSSVVNGTGYGQVNWKKDVRFNKFLSSKDLLKGKLKWVRRKQVFYDGPSVEWVDNYDLWFDWHNIARESKQFWFRRRVMTGEEIKRTYPMADPDRLECALNSRNCDLSNYSSIRYETKPNHVKTVRGADYLSRGWGAEWNLYQSNDDPMLRAHEVFDWWRPYEDAHAVMVNRVPILRGGVQPIPFDFKDVPIFHAPFMKLPGEFEGLSLPLIMEQPQLLLNTIKNQRVDNATLAIHKMWIVSPLANVNKQELVTQPFGIIYTPDPNGVREVQFSDLKESAYREEELLKSDLRYSSGIDDFSQGVGAGGETSATEIRHLRESTLERVRLFVNHLGSALSLMERWWIDMRRQFFTKDIELRILGETGSQNFVLIQKDDFLGNYDFKATVIPSIAGKNDVDKKQAMDLYQLLQQNQNVDQDKLISKVISFWGWGLDDVRKDQAATPPMPAAQSGMPGTAGMPGMPGAVGPDGQPLPAAMPPEGQLPGAPAMDEMLAGGAGVAVSKDLVKRMLDSLGGPMGQSQFAGAAMPIDLLQSQAGPPTVPGVPANSRGLNMAGKVNTTIPNPGNASPQDRILAQSQGIQ